MFKKKVLIGLGVANFLSYRFGVVRYVLYFFLSFTLSPPQRAPYRIWKGGSKEALLSHSNEGVPLSLPGEALKHFGLGRGLTFIVKTNEANNHRK